MSRVKLERQMGIDGNSLVGSQGLPLCQDANCWGCCSRRAERAEIPCVSVLGSVELHQSSMNRNGDGRIWGGCAECWRAMTGPWKELVGWWDAVVREKCGGGPAYALDAVTVVLERLWRYATRNVWGDLPE